jgi:hypothetical protein
MTRLQKPEEWSRTALVVALKEMAANFEYTPAEHWDQEDWHLWSMFRAAAIMLGDDSRRIADLNEALLRAYGQ